MPTIGIDIGRFRGWHSVREAPVGLQRPIPQKICRQRTGGDVRHQQLRTALEDCRQRVQYAQRELDGYTGSLDPRDASSNRTLRKLADDLGRAQDDARSLQKQLDDLMDD